MGPELCAAMTCVRSDELRAVVVSVGGGGSGAGGETLEVQGTGGESEGRAHRVYSRASSCCGVLAWLWGSLGVASLRRKAFGLFFCPQASHGESQIHVVSGDLQSDFQGSVTLGFRGGFARFCAS